MSSSRWTNTNRIVALDDDLSVIAVGGIVTPLDFMPDANGRPISRQGMELTAVANGTMRYVALESHGRAPAVILAELVLERRVGPGGEIVAEYLTDVDLGLEP